MLIFTCVGMAMFWGTPAAFGQNDTLSLQKPLTRLGNQDAIKASTLSFSGLGGDTTIKSGQLSFTGFGNQDAIKAGTLSFVGWGDELEIDAGTVKFQGWGKNIPIKAGEIAFTGWRSSDNVAAGRISFQGCGYVGNKPGPATQSKACSKLPLPASDPIPALPMEGNWIIEWEGAKPERAFATLTKNLNWECHRKDGGCWNSFNRTNKKDWTVAMVIPGLLYSGGSVRFLGGDRVSVSYQGWIFGDWEAQSTGIATEEKISGKWTYGDTSGAEIWTRVRSDISSVQANNDKKVPFGTHLSLSVPYSGPGNNMRGNRPVQKISIFGDNLWGLHRWWIPKESGIEITSIKYHCKEGSFFEFYNTYDMCLKQGGVKSLEFILTFWPQARPSLNVLYFDDKEVPFNLELSGYPTTYPVAAAK
jgi:hypothetical protein